MVSPVSMAPMAHTVATSSPQTPTFTKPSKPLLRRATLSGTVRTRDEAELDLSSDTMSVPSSPSKRARTVTFNPTVEEQIFTSSPTASEIEKNLDMTRIEVKRSLNEHIKGTKEEGYDVLKELFQTKERLPEDEFVEKSEEIKTHLLALTSYVSLLGRTCAGLVKEILACEWVGRDETFVKIYVQFLGNLASAQGAWVGSVLGMLVDKFMSLRISHGRLPGCTGVSRDQLLFRVHGALKYILRLIPSGSGTLAPILATKFPLSDDTKRAHMAYVNNLLRLVEYAPELKSDALALITDRLVKIDIQMQVDLDDMDDEIAAAIVNARAIQSSNIRNDENDREEDDDDDSDADSDTSDESIDDDEGQLRRRIKEAQSNVEKMDGMLDTLFTIYSPNFNHPHSDAARATFDSLLVHFRSIILPTYRSRHTQFLLFHFAQTSEELIDTFIGECLGLAFRSGESSIMKQSAVAYLASFVSRGARVPSHVVLDIFRCLGRHLDAFREKHEATCRGPDLQRYSIFYALTQALLYIFCFRWRDLIVSRPISSDDPDYDDDDFVGRELSWYPGVRELFTRTIGSSLNPLKICSPAIVEEFANVSARLHFVFVLDLIAKNKRLKLSQFTAGASHGGIGALRDSGFASASNRSGVEPGDDDSWYQLDAYFPFDPYRLPVSRRWVEGDYVVWKGIPGVNEDDDEEGGSQRGEEEDEDEIPNSTDNDGDDDDKL